MKSKAITRLRWGNKDRLGSCKRWWVLNRSLAKTPQRRYVLIFHSDGKQQTVSLSVSNWFSLSRLLTRAKSSSPFVFVKSEIWLNNSCHWRQLTLLGWSQVWHLRVNLRGTVGLRVVSQSEIIVCFVDSDSAKVCSPPVCCPSSLCSRFEWLWFCVRRRIWKVVQHFASSSFPLFLSFLLLVHLPSYGFLLFPPPSLLFRSLCHPLFHFIPVSCFLSGPLWPCIRLNSLRQNLISTFKDPTYLPLSSQDVFEKLHFIPDQPLSLCWFSDVTQL